MATINVGDYTDLQDALDSNTLSTGGDVFTFPASSTETITTHLDWSTFGSPTDADPVVFRGLGTGASRGRIEIAGGRVAQAETVGIEDMRILWTSGQHLLNPGTLSDPNQYLKNCDVDWSTTTYQICNTRGIFTMDQCYVYGGGTRIFRGNSATGHFITNRCIFDNVKSFAASTRHTAHQCVFRNGASLDADYATAIRCTFLGTSSASDTAILAQQSAVVVACIIKSYAYGIYASDSNYYDMIVDNGFYDIGTDDIRNQADNCGMIFGNEALSADPLPGSNYDTGDVDDNYTDVTIGDEATNVTSNNARGADWDYPSGGGGGIQIARGMHGGIRG